MSERTEIYLVGLNLLEGQRLDNPLVRSISEPVVASDSVFLNPFGPNVKDRMRARLAIGAVSKLDHQALDDIDDFIGRKIPTLLFGGQGQVSPDTIARIKASGVNQYFPTLSPDVVSRLIGNFLDIHRARIEDSEENPSFFRNEDLIIDYVSHTVTLNDQPIKISLVEYRLLYFLATKMGELSTKAEILNGVWGSEYYAASGDSLLSTTVNRLRKKLNDIKDEDGNFHYIVSKHGVGLMMADLNQDQIG